MKVRQRFAARLRDARRSLRISQEQLAERAGVSVEAYGRLERGLVLPRAETLLALADATGLTVDALLCREGPLRRAAEPIPASFFVEDLEQATEAERRILGAILRELRRLEVDARSAVLTEPFAAPAHR